jgi:hypothetical protein
MATDSDVPKAAADPMDVDAENTAAAVVGEKQRLRLVSFSFSLVLFLLLFLLLLFGVFRGALFRG